MSLSMYLLAGASTLIPQGMPATADQIPTPNVEKTADNGSASAQTAQTDDAPDTNSGDIIVTGEKFGRTRQDTASSVGHVDAKDINNGPLLTAADAYQRIVNVNLANDGRFVIRGVAFNQVTGAGLASLGTLYVDNVRMSDKSTRFGPDLLWDVQSVEVLRGAQSTLQGRNALAGAIYIKSEDPTFDWHAKARVLVANGGGRDYAGAVSGPIVPDVLAFRLTAEKHQTDGFLTDPILKTDKVDLANDLQFRGKLLFQPSAALTSHLTVYYSNNRRRDSFSDTRAIGPDGFQAPNPKLGSGFETGVAGGVPATDRISNVNIPEYDYTRTLGGAWTTDYKLSHDLVLTSETTVAHSLNYNQRDGDNGYFKYNYASPTIPISNPHHIKGPQGDTIAVDPRSEQRENYDIFSQELRLKYNGAKLKALAGLYFTKEREREDNFSLLVFRNLRAQVEPVARSNGLDAATAKFFASFYSNDAPLYTYNAQPVDITNYAAYGEVDYEPTTRLTINVGARYDNENSRSGVIDSGAVLGLADPAALAKINPALGKLAAGINVALNPFADASQFAELSFHAFLPKFSLRYRVSDDTTLGFVVQRAYRAGGVSVNVVRQLVTPLKPEYTTNYEAFVRVNGFGGRFHLDGNVFFTDWTDQQVNIDLSTQNSDSIGANAGHAQLYGFELQADATLTHNLRAYAGLGYSHTEFTQFTLTTPVAASALGIAINPHTFDNLVGNSFARAPEWSGVLGADWHNNAGYFLSGNVTYQSYSWDDIQNTRREDPHTLVNGRIGRQFDHFTLSAFVRNLFDINYVDTNLGGGFRQRLGQPRTVGVAFEIRY